MKKGGRSRKRKTSEVKNNSPAGASSAAASSEDSPQQCLTQNSDGKFVPCFSKKLRLAVKGYSSVASIPVTEPSAQTAAKPATCATVESVDEAGAPEKLTQIEDDSKVSEEIETNSKHENVLSTTETSKADNNAEETRPDTVKAGPAVEDGLNAKSSSDISQSQTSLSNDFLIPGMSLSQIVTPVRREEKDHMRLSCSQPVKVNASPIVSQSLQRAINAPLLQVELPHGIQVPHDGHTELLEQAPTGSVSPISSPQTETTLTQKTRDIQAPAGSISSPQAETTLTQKRSEEEELVMMRNVLELEDSLTGMDDLENLSMDFSEEVVMTREGQSGDTRSSLVEKQHPYTAKNTLEKEVLDRTSDGNGGLHSQMSDVESLSAAIVPTMSPSNHYYVEGAAVPTVHPPVPPPHEGTNMLRGLVDELSALNRFILNCKREMDAGLRQRRAWLRLQQSTSRNK